MRFSASGLGWVVVGLFVALSSVGCCHGEMREFDVNVSLDDSMRDRGVFQSVEVDIVAVNSLEREKWMGPFMTEYFSSNDPNSRRLSADRLTVTLGDDVRVGKKSLKDNDVKKIWDLWKRKGAMYLLVLSSKPLVPDSDGIKDPRRLELPLACERWDGGVKQLNVLVKASGPTVSPPPMPEK